MSVKHRPDSVRELRQAREEHQRQEEEQRQILEEAKQASTKIAALTERVEAYEVRLAAGEKPVPGAAWSSLITYLRDEIVERGGKQYAALRYSKNKPPEDNPDLWEIVETGIPVLVWNDAESGFSFAVGDLVTHINLTWRCIKAHTKSQVRVPLDGSQWWEMVK